MGVNGVQWERKVRGESIQSNFSFFFQAEDGMRGLVRSRGLGDVYKRQVDWLATRRIHQPRPRMAKQMPPSTTSVSVTNGLSCLLYTSDAADDLLCVDLGGRRIINKKTDNTTFTLLASSY